MKRILALLLVAVFAVMALVACGESNDGGANAAVEKYVKENGDTLIENFEVGFTSSGLTCNTTVKAVGDGIVLETRINGMDNIPEESKKVMQDTYDAMDDTFEQLLDELQKEEPAIDYVKINVCEEDGDLLAVIDID